MRDQYTNDELCDQLKQDLTEGESWHIEFKAYNYTLLGTKASVWKDDLSDELAAFASTGGKVYIGIGDDGIVKGISGGSHQDWHEKLFERAVGRIKPKINWKSYLFTDPITGFSLIRIDVLQGEPIYYAQSKPYVRDGTISRPAEPEEVKARWKEYFVNQEPILPIEKPKRPKSHSQEQIVTLSWTADVLINILSGLNLYEQKVVNPQLQNLRTSLESSRKAIDGNLSKVKRAFGNQSDYYQVLEAISDEILAAMQLRIYIDGGKSWAQWLSHIKKIYDMTHELLSTVKLNLSITIDNLNEQEEDVTDTTIRWLSSIDDYKLNKFTYEANRYVRMLLRLHFLFWLSNNEQKAKYYKEIADELEMLSGASTMGEYREIREAIPKLLQKLKRSL